MRRWLSLVLAAAFAAVLFGGCGSGGAACYPTDWESCTCADGDYAIVQGLEIDDFSRSKIDASVAELADERDTVASQGMI